MKDTVKKFLNIIILFVHILIMILIYCLILILGIVSHILMMLGIIEYDRYCELLEGWTSAALGVWNDFRKK